jgi:hypothetical protein
MGQGSGSSSTWRARETVHRYRRSARPGVRSVVSAAVVGAVVLVGCAPSPSPSADAAYYPESPEQEAKRKRPKATTTTAPATTTTQAPLSTTSTTSTTPPSTTTTTTPTDSPVVGADALQRRALKDLRVFTTWLGSERGLIGEVGWPNNASTDRWNALAATWYREADRSGLAVTAWATGEWWGPYELGIYGASGSALGMVLPPAAVVEAHRGAPGPDRGVNVNGGEFGIGQNLGTGSGGSFSNVNRGTFGSTYHYDGQATFNFLAGRGVEVVRLPFRWERIQPAPGGALDNAELTRLRDAIGRAGAAGIQVIPTVMNYGAYWLHNPSTGTGVRTPIGSAAVTEAHFVDLWQRLALALADRPNIHAWGLMNEPVAMPGGAAAWERASQRAVEAVRSTGDRRRIAVPGYNWSTVSRFVETHPGGPWVNDPARNVVYEAHHYFNSDSSGEYRSYDWELAEAVKAGH